MEYTSDPYELKLFQMFQSCDTKQCGYLDETSLRRLCGLLELRDKGSVLIDNLAAEGRTSHVTFEIFKEALLNFLGTELDGGGGVGSGGSQSATAPTITEPSKSTEVDEIVKWQWKIMWFDEGCPSLFDLSISSCFARFVIYVLLNRLQPHTNC